MANFPGTIGNDLINATTGDDYIFGDNGNDTINAKIGNDTVYAGEGNDSVDGGNLNDLIYGGKGNDYIDGGNDQDTIYGEEGNDTIDGNAGHDSITDLSGDNLIKGGSGNDTIDTGDGKDSIDAGSGNDTIHSGGGNDTIDANSGDDLIFGGAGNDSIVANSGNDTIDGGTDSGSLTTFTLTVDFLSAMSVGFNNSFGYYVKNDMGEPTDGKIIWHANKSLTGGEHVSFDVTAESADDIGFFLIPNGAGKNPGLHDGDAVTFGKVGDVWTIYKGGVALQGSKMSGSAENGPSFFSDSNLNPDGQYVHVKDTATEGNTNWEDTFNGGDKDFNDLNLNISITAKDGGEGNGGNGGGDTLTGNSGNDVFVYHAGVDGKDTITDFGVGNDKLQLPNTTLADTHYAQNGSDTVVTFTGHTGSITLLGTTTAYVVDHTLFV